MAVSLLFRRAVEGVMRRLQSVSQAAATAALTLTTSYQDIAGVTLSLNAGNYLIIGIFDFIGTALDAGQTGLGQLDVGGTAQTALATFCLAANSRVTISHAFAITLTSTTTCKLQASKNGGTGTSTASNVHTTITAVRLA